MVRPLTDISMCNASAMRDGLLLEGERDKYTPSVAHLFLREITGAFFVTWLRQETPLVMTIPRAESYS
jgi:hypothetical protein